MKTSEECFFLIGLLFISIVHGHQLSDKRKCADPKCEELISVGKTVNRYDAPAAGLVSYPKDADVKIYSKEAGSNPSLWGVEIRGQRGYANKAFIKETKVFIKDQMLIHEVPSRQIITIETDNVSGDEEEDELDDEPDDELDDELDDEQDDISNADIILGEDTDPDMGEDSNLDTSTPNSQPSAKLNDDIASQSVDKDQLVTKVSIADNHLTENANDYASSTPIVSSPTPLGYDVVDGTTIYPDDDASMMPHYLSETETPPPLPRMTQTLPPTGASQYLLSNSDGEFTPNLEVVPSGEPGDVLTPSEVVSDIVTSTAVDPSVSSNSAQVTVKPLVGSGPLLQSTLSVAVSDNSQVHATTSSVVEQTLGSSQVSASERSEEGFASAGDAGQSAHSKLENKHIEPSAVEQETVGIFSSIASSFVNMFDSTKADDPVEAANGDVDKSIEEEANDIKEAVEEKSSNIVQYNHDNFVATPKQQDIIDAVPNMQIIMETSEQIESVPLNSSDVVINVAEVSADISRVAEHAENIPLSNPSDPIAQQENELKPQELDNSSNNKGVESGEISSSLPPIDNSVSDVAHEMLEKVEMNGIEDSASANLDGSGSASVDGSDLANVGSSNPTNDESSDLSNVVGSDLSNVEGPDLSNIQDSGAITVKSSDSAIVQGSGPINVEGSDSAYVENSDATNVEGSDSANVVGSDPANVGGSDPINVGGSDLINVEGSDPINVDGLDSAYVEGSDSANVEGSDSANVEGSDPANVGGSDPINVGGSDPINVGGSDPINVEGSDPINVDGSDSAFVEGSDSANVEGSDPANVEDSGSLGNDESFSANVIVGDAGSTAGDHGDSNVDELPGEEKFDLNDSNDLQASDPFKLTRTSPEQHPIHKFITNKNSDHSDVNHDKIVKIESTSSKNDEDSSYRHPETTMMVTEQNAVEKMVEEVISDPSKLKDVEVVSESYSSHDGSDGDAEGKMELPSSGEIGENPVSGMEAHWDHHQHSQKRVSRTSRINASKVKPIVRTEAPGPVVAPSSLLSTKSAVEIPTSASPINSIVSPSPLEQQQRKSYYKINERKFSSKKSFEELVDQLGRKYCMCSHKFADIPDVIRASTELKKVSEHSGMMLFSSMNAVDSTSSPTVKITQDLETFLMTSSVGALEPQILKGKETDKEQTAIELTVFADSSNGNHVSMQDEIASKVSDLTPSGDSGNADPSDGTIAKMEKSEVMNLQLNPFNNPKSKLQENVNSKELHEGKKTSGYLTNWHTKFQASPISVTSYVEASSDPFTIPTPKNDHSTTKAIESTSLLHQHDPLLLGSLGSATAANLPKDSGRGNGDDDDDVGHDPVKPKRLSGSAVPQPSDKPGKETEDQGLNVQDKENQGLSGSNQDKQDLGGLDLHDPNTIAGQLMQVAEPILGDSLSLAIESEAGQSHLSSRTLLSLLLIAFTFVVVMLYSVHALLMKCSREGPLLEALNVMEHEHHVAAAVIMQLQEKLVAATSGSPACGAETTFMYDNAEVARLTEQLQLLQEEATSRATRIQELEQELEESTNSGLEMHAMLQDLLHEQRDTAGFQDSVDHLQKMLDSQREKVESLTSDLSIKTTLNDELKSETKTSREKISKLEYQLEQVTHSLEEVSSSKDRVQRHLTEEQSRAQAVTNQLRDLTQVYEHASAALSDLQSKHTASEQKTERLQKLLRTKETELHVTKECLKQLKLFNDGKGSKEKLTQMLDVIKVQALLSTAQRECSDLQQQLQQRADEAAGLEEAAREAKSEAERCLDLQQQADSERSDALSKLAVLTSYFQEKEAQLTKELESESGLRHNAEGSAETVSSRIRDYDLQLLACKTQVEGLKKELDDQEQSYRAQLAAQEQKAHESWVVARAAERKLDESKQETSQLRSRLLLASKEGADIHAIVKPIPKHSEVSNGSLSSPRPPLHDDLDGEHCLPLNPMDSPPHIPPPHMLPPHLFPPHGAPPLPHGMPPFPPPPGMHPPGMHPPHHFLPPPLPPPMLSDRRLPPAGRLASPSFHRRSPPDYLDRHGPPSPPFDQRRSPAHYDRRSYSPSSEHSRYSDRQGRYSPDRHSERQYSDSRHHNDRYHLHNNGGDRHLDRYSPERLRDSSPDRWLNRSPDGYARKPSPPRRLYDDQHRKGKKTSTPLGPNDR